MTMTVHLRIQNQEQMVRSMRRDTAPGGWLRVDSAPVEAPTESTAGCVPAEDSKSALMES